VGLLHLLGLNILTLQEVNTIGILITFSPVVIGVVVRFVVLGLVVVLLSGRLSLLISAVVV
jgi:hypothetical protein